MAMVDFPPNPEDGELWLPSYICHEISPKKTKPKKKTNIADHHSPLSPAPPLFSTGPPFPLATPKIEVYTLPCFMPNVKAAAIGNIVDHGYYSPRMIGGFPAVPGPIYLYNPIIPTQSQAFDAVFFHGKSEGTGFYLPRPVTSKVSGHIKGTGVFLNHQVMVKSKKGGKNVKGSEKKQKCLVKEETRGKKEESKLPTEIYCLPQEWSY